MPTKQEYYVVRDLRGGRNDTDPPLALPENQVVEALNVDWFEGTLARKRNGSTAVSETGGTAFSSGMQSLFRFVPGASETAAELWGIDGAATPIVKRMAAGTSFANVTLSDAIATKPQEVIAAALNGKHFVAYDSTVDRLHVYDTKLSTPQIRRVGLPTGNIAPSVANTGSGSYAATVRYYRVRWLQLNYTKAQSQETVNTADALRANSNSQRLAQGFQLSTAGQVIAFETTFAKTGTPHGSVYVTVEADSAGSPSGTPLQTSNSITTSSIVDSSTTYMRFTFPTPVSLSASTQYHLVMYGTFAVDASHFVHWRGNTAGGYASGSAKDFDGAAWTAATNSADFVFRLYVVTDGTTGPLIYRRSEPTPVQAFTPSGSGTGVTITQPTVPGEQETHWEIEASSDNATFYGLYAFNGTGYLGDAIPIATTTGTDTATTSQYPSGSATDPIGTYALPRSAKFLLSDGNRLLLAGSWEAGGPNSQVEYTAVLGSSDKADDERIPNTTSQKNRVNLNENDGGAITALMGPLEGVPYVGKYRQLWRLVPTGDVASPYLPKKVSDWVGVVHGKAWCVGRDEAGHPCLYFYSTYGPYRYGRLGLQYMGRDNETLWATVNLAATGVPVWLLYVPEKHQVWWHVATSASNDPDTRMVFDVLLGRVDEGNQVRGGWSRHTGNTPSARCGVLFSNTLGASMSLDVKPYIGRATGTTIQKADTSATDDAGTTFQAYVKMRPMRAAIGHKLGIGQSTLGAKAASGVTITQTIDRDFNSETTTATAVLTAAASETHVFRKVEGSQMSGADVIQLQIGDGAAAANAWTLNELVVPVDLQEAR